MIKHLKLQKKTKMFLGLMKKLRYTDTNLIKQTPHKSIFSLNFIEFKKAYISLLNIIYVLEFIRTTPSEYNFSSKTTNNLIYFYAKLSKLKKNEGLYSLASKLFHTHNYNNAVIFTKPGKQLFLVLFKNKPTFVFTCGLMRIVMNEKRKSGKKLYKVAISLIKLSVILLKRKNYFDSCYIKLNNVGHLRPKILSTFSKSKLYNTINYVVFKINCDMYSQKFKTRRSIKKYVKKRFKLNT